MKPNNIFQMLTVLYIIDNNIIKLYFEYWGAIFFKNVFYGINILSYGTAMYKYCM